MCLCVCLLLWSLTFQRSWPQSFWPVAPRLGHPLSLASAAGPAPSVAQLVQQSRLVVTQSTYLLGEVLRSWLRCSSSSIVVLGGRLTAQPWLPL